MGTAAAFTYDLTTNRGKVRLKLADTKQESAWFTDAELDALLTEGGSVNAAVALGARVLLADRARRTRAFSSTAAGINYNDTAQVAALRELITLYGNTYPDITVTMPALLPMDAGFDETDP